MDIDSENTETQTIARAFVKVIRERIPNETLVRIDAENAARVGTSGALLCSTDDHCDGNDAMIEAFRRCGKPYSDQWAACDAHAKLWGEVWEAAKRAGFADNDAWWCDGCCEEKPDATPTGLNDDGTTYCPACDLLDSADKAQENTRTETKQIPAIFTSQSHCHTGRYVCGTEQQKDLVFAAAIDMRDRMAAVVGRGGSGIEIEIQIDDGNFSCFFDLSAFDLDAVTVGYCAALNDWAKAHGAEVVD